MTVTNTETVKVVGCTDEENAYELRLYQSPYTYFVVGENGSATILGMDKQPRGGNSPVQRFYLDNKRKTKNRIIQFAKRCNLTIGEWPEELEN